MRTKHTDTPYCGVQIKNIVMAQPTLNYGALHHFKQFVIDRYKIHKRKDVRQLPPPWTNNPILLEYKFTNVRREHDRQTRYLLDNITNNPELTLEDKIVNSFLFRAWNNWDTLQDFGFPYSCDKVYSPELKHTLLRTYEDLNADNPNRLWYNNAYNQGGTKHAWERLSPKHPVERNIPLRPFHVGVWLGQQNIVEKLLKAKDQQECFEIIKTVRGFADFLAYQVFVDLTYIPQFPFSENEFVVAGPGCKKGLDYIFEDRDGMSYEECIFWLRDRINGPAHDLFNSRKLYNYEKTAGYMFTAYNPDTLFNDLPSFDRRMNVMSIENCMCELSKYLRTVRGEGRPKNHYRPTNN